MGRMFSAAGSFGTRGGVAEDGLGKQAPSAEPHVLWETFQISR